MPAAAQWRAAAPGFLTVRHRAACRRRAQMEQGIQLFLKERNNVIAGRKVELTIADTGGNPAQAKTRTQEADRAQPRARHHRAARHLRGARHRRYIKQAQVPLITPTSAAQKDSPSKS